MRKIIVILLVFVLVCGVAFTGCNAAVELPDGLPTLEEASKMSGTTLTEKLLNLSEKQMHALWGTPDDQSPAMNCDTWWVNRETGTRIVVHYNKLNGKWVVDQVLTGNGENTVQTYLYEYRGEGYGGKFTIALKSDGTFQYHEGDNSDHFGYGMWSMDDSGSICLREKADENGKERVNYFKAFGSMLIWVQENSDNFKYVTVINGGLFTAIEQESNEPGEPNEPNTPNDPSDEFEGELGDDFEDDFEDDWEDEFDGGLI